MSTFTSILSGVAGLAIIAGATPATAQYAPNGGYNNGYNNGGVVGAVINSVLGGGRYGAYGQGADRNAVDQCARAAEARVSADYRNGRDDNGGYGNGGYGNHGYNQANVARVVGITGVERKTSGLKVSGLINSGWRQNVAYGNQAYGNQGYGNQGYGNPNYASTAQNADLRFSCRVDFRGYVSSVKIDRMTYRRG